MEDNESDSQYMYLRDGEVNINEVVIRIRVNQDYLGGFSDVSVGIDFDDLEGDI